ncbi:unnamed protein product, partial [Onchocerca ochengi]
PNQVLLLQMSTTAFKKYGLILKKPSELSKPTVKPIAAAFASDDDDGIEVLLVPRILSNGNNCHRNGT